MRIVITPISGAFTSGPKNDDAASAVITAGTEVGEQREDGEGQRDEGGRAQVAATVAADDPHGGDAFLEHGAHAEGREEGAGHLRARKYLVREHGEAGTSICLSPLVNSAVMPSTRNMRSRSRKRIPASIPRPSSDCGRGGREGTSSAAGRTRRGTAAST